MGVRLPETIQLAQRPTPLERLERIGGDLGIDLCIKRDDLTGAALSGNKVRKLEFLLAEAQRAEADVVITCGAVGSNHARATAVAAAQIGMSCKLLLRGADQHPPAGNLLLDRLVGADIELLSPDRWPDRDERMRQIARELEAEERTAYIIPEGGSNAAGAMGYVVAIDELLAQEEEQGISIGAIVHAAGSGGTTAGLALGLAARGRTEVAVHGVAVCQDAAHFDARITEILDEAVSRHFVDLHSRTRARWHITEGFMGLGYGRTTREEMVDYATVARREGVILDPVYSGKAFRALCGLAREGLLPRDKATVFLHTGGIFGLFAFAEEVDGTAG